MPSKKVLNLLGLKCPETMMMVRKKIFQMKKNEILLILSDDKSSIQDIPNFCFFMQYKLLQKKIKKKPYTYIINI